MSVACIGLGFGMCEVDVGPDPGLGGKTAESADDEFKGFPDVGPGVRGGFTFGAKVLLSAGFAGGIGVADDIDVFSCSDLSPRRGAGAGSWAAGVDVFPDAGLGRGVAVTA